MTASTTAASATAQLNGHRALPADPDPPTREPHKMTRVLRTLALHLSTIDRLDLWQLVSDSEGQPTVAVPRKQLIHVLLDHSNMIDRLARIVALEESYR
jgi:hypothetical protein